MTSSKPSVAIRKIKRTAPARRRGQLLEGLESRRLFVAYNPLAAPLITVDENANATAVNVATFASTSAIGNLTASVDFPAGTTTAPSVAASINLIGSVFVPGVGAVPEYAVRVDFTAGATPTGASQPQFTVHLNDSADGTAADVYGNIQVVDPATPNDFLSVSPAPVVVPEGSSIPAGTNFGTFTDAGATQAGETYAATALVNGVSIPLTLTQVGTSATFTLTSTSLAVVNLAAGPSTFSLDVTSSTGLETTAAGPLTVTTAPLTFVSVNPTPSATVGTPSTINLAIFHNTNVSYPLSSYLIAIDWGDGSPTSIGTAVASVGDVLVTGSHAYRTPGSYAVTIAVTDPDGQALNISVPNLTVAAAALSTGTASDFNGQRGQSLQNVLLGTFTDANPLATAADFSASVDFGDGSIAAPGIITLIGTSGGNAVFAVYGSHTFVNAGTFVVNATVTDTSSNTTAIVPTATIGDTIAVSPAPVFLTEGSAVPAGTVFGTFADPGVGGGVTYTAFAVVNGTSVPLTVAAISVGSHTFSLVSTANTAIPGGLAVGTAVFGIVVSDSDGIGAASAGTLTVAPATLSLSATAIPTFIIEGRPLVATSLATFTSPNTLAVPADFAASIDWGDGSQPTPGTITLVGGVFRVAGNHTFTSATIAGSPDQITVTISDSANRRRLASTSAILTVADAPLTTPLPAPVIHSIAGQQFSNVLVGTFVDTNPFADAPTYAASINWGDGSALSAGTFARLGTSAAGAIYGVYGTHTYTALAAQPFLVTSSVTSAGGNALTGYSAALVADAPITAAGSNFAGVARQLTSATVATFTSTPFTDFAATINWGDGSSSAGTIADDGNGHYHVSGSHLYNPFLGGSYPVNVTITHAGGSSATVSALASIFAPKLLADAPVELAAARNKTFKGILGSFTDQNQLNHAAANYVTGTSYIYWGDGTKTKLTAADLKLTGTDPAVGGFWRVLGSHKYATNGDKFAKVLITSKYGQHLTLKFKVTVGDAEPV